MPFFDIRERVIPGYASIYLRLRGYEKMGLWRPKNHRNEQDNDEKFHKTIGNRNAVRICDPFYLPGVSS